MRTLIFDIETVGEVWEDFDEVTQRVLTRWIDRSVKNNEERDLQLKDLREGLGFSPLTGHIVAIGVYDLERSQGAVYYVGNGNEVDDEVGDFIYKKRTEAEMLQEFWDGAREYDTFVTFNGRSFDIPFINHRSVVHRITPSRELMKYRYLSQQSAPYHIDLQDELTWYGAMIKRPSLHLFCRAYGITSPKGDGISGDDVAGLFAQKKFREIAQYNTRDVVATKELYELWFKNLAPTSFLNMLDF
ncbi:ribonuclease H-like domain-containing protein [Patescibacteria group bacterium]|nr:ribonuclease H-like domain-containing protein [Patescibacteria group bacterium]